MSPGTMSLALILWTALRFMRYTFPISGSYSFKASMAFSALRSCVERYGREKKHVNIRAMWCPAVHVKIDMLSLHFWRNTKHKNVFPVGFVLLLLMFASKMADPSLTQMEWESIFDGLCGLLVALKLNQQKQPYPTAMSYWDAATCHYGVSLTI